MADYNKSLADKLGIKSGMRVIIMRAPAGYELDLAGAEVVSRLAGRFDFIQYFASSPEQLGAVTPNLAAHLEPGAMLWVCWAKRTSPLHSDLDEATVRRLGVKAGLVDVKVASVSEDWSGLKFIYRLPER